MKLYLKNVKRKRKDTVYSFLYTLFFNEWSRYTITDTYYDKECKNLECSRYKARSFEALFSIVSTYFPNVTEKKLAKTLEKFLLEDPQGCCFLFCKTAKKWIFHLSGTYWVKRDEDYCRDYNGTVEKQNLKTSKGDGKYTLEDILKLMKE